MGSAAGFTAFEWFVAARYLRARRKEKVVSVVTVISVIGVWAGVMALVISLAVNNGFRGMLQRSLLSATAHVQLERKDTSQGIADWRELTAKLQTLPHVVAAAPVLYDQVVISGPQGNGFVVLKGIDKQAELEASDVLHHLKSGSLDGLPTDKGLPGIVLGSKAAQDAGLSVNDTFAIIDPEGTLTPNGPTARTVRFRVTGIFESGFYDFDDHWAFTALPTVQNLMSSGDVVNDIELRADDPNRAPEVAKEAESAAGNRYATKTWEDQNKQLFDALKLERIVTFITIGLIEIVAALNILIALTMIVLTKFKDIAVLMSMGARRAQIWRIFIMQGAMIGITGTVLGMITGYAFCYFADTYRWMHLDETIYALSFVPFEPRLQDGLWIAGAAIGVSLLATIYPARNATRITPVEVLRYE
jgi:lipoprotein-releasing system permease protein